MKSVETKFQRQSKDGADRLTRIQRLQEKRDMLRAMAVEWELVDNPEEARRCYTRARTVEQQLRYIGEIQDIK